MMFLVIIIALGVICPKTVQGQEFTCPDVDSIETSLITSFISVDDLVNDTMTVCDMEYEVPQGASLYQGMLAASQQQPNFTFTTLAYTPEGRTISSINGITPPSTAFFWALHAGNGAAQSLADLDSMILVDNSSFIWSYQQADLQAASPNYTGECIGNRTIIPPSTSLTYQSVYLTVSDENTADFSSGTGFNPVCTQLVLFTPSQPGPSLYDVLGVANDQVPLAISAGLESDRSLMSMNNISNQDGYIWEAYNGTSNAKLDRDLNLTTISADEEIVFRFTQVEAETTTADDGVVMTTDSAPGILGGSLMATMLSVLSVFLVAYV